MNYHSTARICSHPFVRLLRTATSLFAILAAAGLSALAADATATGTISGSVSSKSTHNALQGAVVSLKGLNRTVLTDEAGQFLLSQVPAGTVEVTVSYSGFDLEQRTVAVGAGDTARLDLVLQTADAIAMEAFTVSSVREGQALSMTEQRNALNIRNVTALDEWGVLPTQNVGELVTRLPGVMVGQQDEDGLIMNVSIGGQPASYTRLNIDGMSSTGVSPDGRTASMHAFSASLYESIEIIAGQTPDRRADSLGGQLNLKSRSPLAMKEKRRVSYGASGRWFPTFADRSTELAQHSLRGDANVTYTEVFDVFGGKRNLGVVLTASYQKVINPHSWSTLLYESTVNPVAQLRDYTRQSGLNDRFISAFSARADYRWSPRTMASLRFQYNGGSEPFFSYTAVNPWVTGSAANLSVNDPVTNPNGAIKAGYTADRIEILPVAQTTLQPGNVAIGAGQMRFNPQKYSFTSKNPTGTLVFEHNLGRLKLDHAYRWSNTHWDSGAGRDRENGNLTIRTKDPIGFILDRSDLDGKVYTPTTGANVYSIASYTAYVTQAANTTTQPVPITSNSFIKRDTITDTNEVSANVNASYNFDVRGYPVIVKTGLDTVNRRVNSRAVYPRRWYQVPGSVLPVVGLMPVTEFERQNGGPRLPILDPAAMSSTLTDPALWYEDVNYTALQQYTGRYILEEGVDSAYVQGQAKIGRLTFLAGVRGEWVNTETFTYFARTTRTPIAVEPDHFKRAAMDYNRQSRDGSYHKYFPSYHLAYDITKNLKLRGSWSTSYGRPRRQDIIPTPVISETARTVTIGNSELKPQMAKNIDLKLEYYFGNGMVSVRGYKKKITDYIGSAVRSGLLVDSGADNGFDGLYENFEIIQSGNLGSANLRGLEFDFRKPLNFLPGFWKGLILRGNYTYLETWGRFAGTTDLKNGQVAGFIPKAANVGLIYYYRNFGANFDMNFTGRYPIGYSLTSPQSGNIYRDAFKTMNAGFSYRIRLNATLFLSVNNIAQEGMRNYIFMESRTRTQYIMPRSLKFGINGQF